MKGTIVARRYSRALFNIGLTDGRTEDYRLALNELAGLFRADQRLPEVLDNPLYGSKFREELLAKLIEGLDPAWESFANFLRLLYDKRRLGVLSDIADAYQELADTEAGRLRAEVTSAAPLDDAATARIADALTTRLGKQVSVQVQVDPSLLAGFRAQVGSLVIDGSITGQLNRLKEALTQGRS